MFRYFLFIITCLYISSAVNPTKEELNKIYQCEFKVNSNRNYFKVAANFNSDHSIYDELGIKNWRYLDYLVKENHFLNPIPKHYRNFTPKRLQSEFILDLSNQKDFLLKFNYLSSYIIDNNQEKEIISLKDILDLASNYFYLESMDQEGNFKWQFGSNKNVYESEHNISAKSFCHLTLFRYMVSKDFQFLSDYTQYQKVIFNKIGKLKISDEEKLELASTNMKNFMKKNNNLIFVLMHSFEESKAFLSFEIVN